MNTPPSNKGIQRRTELLTPAEIRAMFDMMLRCPYRPSATNLRNRAILAMILGGGLRIAETLALLPQHVDPETGRVHVLFGKGSKERVVSLNHEALPHVVRWMQARQEYGGLRQTQPLFCVLKATSGSRKGRPLSDRFVRTMFNEAAAKAKITKRVHPHGFRHMHAVSLEQAGVPVTEISGQLGHTSIATTQIYLNVYSPTARLKRAHEVDMDLGLSG